MEEKISYKPTTVSRVVVAKWLSDTREEIPRLLKVIDGNSALYSNLKLIIRCGTCHTMTSAFPITANLLDIAESFYPHRNHKVQLEIYNGEDY